MKTFNEWVEIRESQGSSYADIQRVLQHIEFKSKFENFQTQPLQLITDFQETLKALQRYASNDSRVELMIYQINQKCNEAIRMIKSHSADLQQVQSQLVQGVGREVQQLKSHFQSANQQPQQPAMAQRPGMFDRFKSMFKKTPSQPVDARSALDDFGQ